MVVVLSITSHHASQLVHFEELQALNLSPLDGESYGCALKIVLVESLQVYPQNGSNAALIER